MNDNNSPFMNPYTDFGFKKLFGTEPNKDLLISFLNALFDDNHEVYDKLTFYYVEMPKFKKTEDELVTMQDKWLYVLKNVCYLLKQPKELQDQVFTKFFEEARIGMFTKEEQFAYMVSQKHYWDNHNTIAYSYEKGEANAKSEIARKLLSMGLSKEQVFEATGYSL